MFKEPSGKITKLLFLTIKVLVLQQYILFIKSFALHFKSGAPLEIISVTTIRN